MKPMLSIHEDLEETARAAADFSGSQYGLAQPLFYRPWVTFSLGLESALFGLSPALLKLSNLALFAAGLLAFRALALRLGLGSAGACCAGWACAWFPFGAGSVLWLVGRVDAHLFGFGLLFHVPHVMIVLLALATCVTAVQRFLVVQRALTARAAASP